MGCEYSRELTQISEENAIFLVASEGFEGVKFLPQLHYASSSESPAPNASTMPKRRPKTKKAKTRQSCSRFIGVNSHEFRTNSRDFIQIPPS